MLVNRVLPFVAAFDEQRREAVGVEVGSRPHAQRPCDQRRRVGQSREQRRGRGHDDPGAARSQREQGAGPGRRDPHVGRERAVRVDLERGERQHYGGEHGLAQPIDRAEEEAHVGDHRVDVRIRGHDEQHGFGRLLVGGRSDGQGLGLRRQPVQAGRAGHGAFTGDGALEKGTQREG